MGDIPDGHLPLALAGVLDDFAFGFIGFVGLNPQPRESSVDIVGELVTQFHGVPFFGLACFFSRLSMARRWWSMDW